jgi:hypothetical protein
LPTCGYLAFCRHIIRQKIQINLKFFSGPSL